MPRRLVNGPCRPRFAIMPTSGTRTGVTNMAAFWILVSSLLPSFYAAIAYDRQSGAYGFAYDQPSPVAAGRRALDRCGSPGCALVLEFGDGCGAYATGQNAAAGAGSDYTRAAAENRALAQCRSAGGNCQVKVWTCNSTPGTEPPIAPLEPPYDGLYFGPAPR
jgi:hypothetical protein